MERNWESILEILVDGETGIVGWHWTAEDKVQLNPQIVAGMMTSLLDAVINEIPENEQIEWEKSIVDYFNIMVDRRFDLSYKEKYRAPE